MEFLKALFENGALTWEQFSEAVNAKGYKVADLSTGNYVSKQKYDNDIQTRDTTISDLNGQISTRDTDIAGLKQQIEDGGKDNDTKISELTNKINTLQTNYDTQKNDYEKRISAMNYEYAVKDFASTKKFSSDAAKRDFINQMISANLTMQDKSIMGAEDFAKKYKESNSDAFIVEEPKPQEPKKEPDKPMFIQPTPPQPAPSDNAFINAFNFTGVRPHDNK